MPKSVKDTELGLFWASMARINTKTKQRIFIIIVNDIKKYEVDQGNSFFETNNLANHLTNLGLPLQLNAFLMNQRRESSNLLTMIGSRFRKIHF